MGLLLDDERNYHITVDKSIKQLKKHGISPEGSLLSFIKEKAKSGMGFQDILGMFGIRVLIVAKDDNMKELAKGLVVLASNLADFNLADFDDYHGPISEENIQKMAIGEYVDDYLTDDYFEYGDNFTWASSPGVDLRKAISLARSFKTKANGKRTDDGERVRVDLAIKKGRDGEKYIEVIVDFNR